MYDELAAVYRDVVGDLPYREWAAFVCSTWNRDDVPVRRVLDVGCGTGLLTRELVDRGYELTGVDASDAMLVEARTLLGDRVALGRTVLPELTLPDPHVRFDAAVCTFDCLNYLRPDELPVAIAAVAAVLRPGGWFVLDLHTDAMLRTIAAAPVSAARSGSLELTMTSRVHLAARSVETRLHVVPDDGPAFDEEHVQHFFTDDRVRHACAAAGLEVLRVVDDYTDAPLAPDSLRATWVLRSSGT